MPVVPCCRRDMPHERNEFYCSVARIGAGGEFFEQVFGIGMRFRLTYKRGGVAPSRQAGSRP